jgi:MYND finger
VDNKNEPVDYTWVAELEEAQEELREIFEIAERDPEPTGQRPQGVQHAAAVEEGGRLDQEGLKGVTMLACKATRGNSLSTRTRPTRAVRAAALAATPSRQRCAQCKSIAYCSRRCQRKDWAEHRKVCKAGILPVDDVYIATERVLA